MITAPEDVKILTEADFERLPDEGLWEVTNGRAILLPGNDCEHQDLVGELFDQFRTKLKALGSGYVAATVNVEIPVKPGSRWSFENRVPDLSVATQRPATRRFKTSNPPSLVIEVLSSRRGNVERTEKLDDYARAGILEYWIVDPFERSVEVYLLEGTEYVRRHDSAPETLTPVAFPSVEIDLKPVWAVLD